nr:very short patch repair endonuclease [Pseudomonas aeruginosa]
MSRTPQRDNPRERALRSELHRRGLRFRLHRRVLVSSRRSVDIAFPTSRTAVFMDGLCQVLLTVKLFSLLVRPLARR